MRANIDVNEVRTQNREKKVQTGWEIEDVTKQKAIRAKNWPLLNKNNLLAVIKNTELEIRFEDKVMITSQLEEIMTDMEIQRWLTDTHLLTMDRVLVMKTSNELMKELFRGKNIAQ
ncbi:hypothetical protein F8M41_026590 [Gigaspora margarita]|uniref:Uncharacterized protein n=1 Tax=Gigaspora margarita TaxID=4874 RepID=A0A8H3XHD4_GIGMA|nr:hypothetical protein F8M41_026590 [Gigaspora margarita]